MKSFLRVVKLVCLLAAGVSSGMAAADEVRSAADISATARKIDQFFAEAWERENVRPAPQADDSEYLRRVYLDIAGRIPAVSELREFLAEDAPNKRQQVVDELLDRPSFVRHFTIVYRNALIPQANSQAQFRSLIPGFEAWLWKHLAEGHRYDEIAREIITAELNTSNGPALVSTTSPDAFFVVRDLKPENLASGTARAFLGVRLDCAQCHDHPFDKWSQQQFWNLAAFYAGFDRPEPDEPGVMMSFTENTKARTIRIPGTEDVVAAQFLTGTAPNWKEIRQPREALADWIVSDDNPWFARMAVNRIWAQLFGRGLVDPVDDFSDTNPASHPEVLELLAEDFIASDYDLRHLLRVLTATRVYQLTSQQTHESQQESVHFAKAALRGLTPEQLFDSLAEAVGYYQPYRSDNPFVVDMDSPRAQFLELFRDSAESPLDHETTILQALTMMNGNFVADATGTENSRTLRAIIEFPAMTTDQKLETLFMTTLSRRPTSAEATRFRQYVESGGPLNKTDAALADVFWALLNSSEFLLNH